MIPIREFQNSPITGVLLRVEEYEDLKNKEQELKEYLQRKDEVQREWERFKEDMKE